MRVLQVTEYRRNADSPVSVLSEAMSQASVLCCADMYHSHRQRAVGCTYGTVVTVHTPA